MGSRGREPRLQGKALHPPRHFRHLPFRPHRSLCHRSKQRLNLSLPHRLKQRLNLSLPHCLKQRLNL
jgi:hypothetical protein